MPFETIARTKGIEVTLDLEDAQVTADRDLLSHALENVLANAFRHADAHVDISADGHGLSVSNDGDVPSPGEVRSLFDRYRTTRAGAGGTGIGLALTKEICDLHGFALAAALDGPLLTVTITFG